LTFGVVVGGPSPSYIITSLEVNRLNLDSVCVGDHSSCRRCFLSLWFSSSPSPEDAAGPTFANPAERERERDGNNMNLMLCRLADWFPTAEKKRQTPSSPLFGNWFDLSELYRWQTWLYWIRFLCAIASC
jgi:hypothetical protein